MAIILFDNQFRKRLFPLTATKAVAALRFGIVTIRERWALQTKQPVFMHTPAYLQPLYPLPEGGEGDHTWVDASVLPSEALLDALQGLDPGCCLADETGLIAGRLVIAWNGFDATESLKYFTSIRDYQQVVRLSYPWQLMQWNDTMIREDFKLITKGRRSAPISSSNRMIQDEEIFIEAGANITYSILNAATGPIYIGKNAMIMEGSSIRGPFVLGHNALLKMNSKIYGATTLGPYCMGGGEIKNTVMMGYSNKAHDGYLGDAVVGEWCNFGAGSSNSNVKNTAGMVKVWDFESETYLNVGQKCGVIMGDYSRTAINTAINTGSVIGVSSNVFGAGLLPTIIGNFSWGVNGGRYEFEKALQDIDNWKKLKQERLGPAESAVLQTIFGQNR
ncbi:MAG: GlmU family protein [Sediminibacterium sp.]